MGLKQREKWSLRSSELKDVIDNVEADKKIVAVFKADGASQDAYDDLVEKDTMINGDGTTTHIRTAEEAALRDSASLPFFIQMSLAIKPM